MMSKTFKSRFVFFGLGHDVKNFQSGIQKKLILTGVFCTVGGTLVQLSCGLLYYSGEKAIVI
jgi:hypothetical protein